MINSLTSAIRAIPIPPIANAAALPNLATLLASDDMDLASASASSTENASVDDTDDLTYKPINNSAGANVVSASSSTSTAPGTVGYYEQFMPTRPGFSSTALAQAVINPGTESLSSGLSPAEVAAAARQSINANYAAMAASGQPFNVNRPGGTDWYTAMGDLDRSALNAVSTNESGLFTQQEQNIAQSIMVQQQGLAIGAYGGPESQASKYVDPYQDNTSGMLEADVKWLDQVGNDEKTSVAWAFNRASAQTSYLRDLGPNETPDDLNSDSPLVQLIMRAMSTTTDNPERATTYGTVRTANDLLEQPWFSGFEGQLGNAIAENDSMYQQTA